MARRCVASAVTANQRTCQTDPNESGAEVTGEEDMRFSNFMTGSTGEKRELLKDRFSAETAL